MKPVSQNLQRFGAVPSVAAESQEGPSLLPGCRETKRGFEGGVSRGADTRADARAGGWRMQKRSDSEGARN